MAQHNLAGLPARNGWKMLGANSTRWELANECSALERHLAARRICGQSERVDVSARLHLWARLAPV